MGLFRQRKEQGSRIVPKKGRGSVCAVILAGGSSSRMGGQDKMAADLAGKTVEVQADSSAEAALKEMPDLMSSFGTVQTTPDYNTAFMDLEMGAVDAIAMDIIVAGYQIEQRQNGCVILDESIASEEYGIGFKKGNEALRDKVQEALEEMAADGTMTEISMKWFGEDVTTIGK